LKGAALDVFEKEPLPRESPLLTLDNITVTPHIAGASTSAAHRAAQMLSNDIKSYREDPPVLQKLERTKI
jgi:phosphoglycerate dehydrogenase-like enzyme